MGQPWSNKKKRGGMIKIYKGAIPDVVEDTDESSLVMTIGYDIGARRMNELTECSTLECHNVAIARSIDTGTVLCIECAIKVVKQHGPDTVETIEGMKFPWEYTPTSICDNCGVYYNMFLTSVTGGCPKCHKTLP
jgi:hypothetical protein